MKRTKILLLLVMAWSSQGLAQWNRDTAQNTIVCNEINNQTNAWIFPDENDGIIAVWQDDRSMITGGDIYFQRLDSQGNRILAPAGVPVCTMPSSQIQLHAASDGEGGAFLAWNDEAGYKVFVQRINNNGQISWSQSGIQVSQRQSIPAYPRIISDGVRGAIVAWSEPRNDINNLIYVQRIASDGSLSWRNGGVRMKISANAQAEHTIVPDGFGGAIVLWSESDSRIWAQAVAADGALRWGNDGRLIGSVSGGASSPEAIPDGNHGVIVAWDDNRSNQADYNIYAQRIDYSGNSLWMPGGVPVCVEQGAQNGVKVILDASGNSIFSWIDARFQNEMVYAQRLNADGFRQWPPNGIAVCNNTGSKPETIALMPDLEGGAYLAWDDRRNAGSTADIYAQRIDIQGISYWKQNGIPVSTANRDQTEPRMVIDSAAHAYLVWNDRRNSVIYSDLYAAVLWHNGLIPVEFSMFRAHTVDGYVTLEWITESEQSNYGFFVERSSGQHVWEDAGFVGALGDHSGQRRYSFTDGKPLLGGTRQYRLRQIDTDGTTTYSPTVEAHAVYQCSPELHAIYPQPAQTKSTVRFTLPSEDNVAFSMYTLLGVQVAIPMPNRRFSAGTYSLELSLAGLQEGMYYLRMETPSGASVLPLIVQR